MARPANLRRLQQDVNLDLTFKMLNALQDGSWKNDNLIICTCRKDLSCRDEIHELCNWCVEILSVVLACADPRSNWSNEVNLRFLLDVESIEQARDVIVQTQQALRETIESQRTRAFHQWRIVAFRHMMKQIWPSATTHSDLIHRYGYMLCKVNLLGGFRAERISELAQARIAHDLSRLSNKIVFPEDIDERSYTYWTTETDESINIYANPLRFEAPLWCQRLWAFVAVYINAKRYQGKGPLNGDVVNAFMGRTSETMRMTMAFEIVDSMCGMKLEYLTPGCGRPNDLDISAETRPSVQLIDIPYVASECRRLPMLSRSLRLNNKRKHIHSDIVPLDVN
jgi:hypothetical protein